MATPRCDTHRYHETHPWITFDAREINDLSALHWMMVGEARSKCATLAGTPLRPDVAQRLYQVALVKGAAATTAIEGNTLTEEQVSGILDGTFEAPPSRAYQQREVTNVLDAVQEIDNKVITGEAIPITTELICEFNKRVLDGTEYEPEAIPGKIRSHSVGVHAYRGAPFGDCEHLVARLAEWLEGDDWRSTNPDLAFARAVLAAIYAHLYIAWIHPFGDGNGRTARLLEFLILARCGQVPLPAAHLLSNHYNLTRDQYYRELARASRNSTAIAFVEYAMQGFVDGLREQIDDVRSQQVSVAWVNYVHDLMNAQPSSKARDRRRTLALDMPSGDWIRKQDLAGLTPALASLYAEAGPRTLSRDLNELTKLGLIQRAGARGTRYRSRDFIIKAFMPPMARNDDLDG